MVYYILHYSKIHFPMTELGQRERKSPSEVSICTAGMVGKRTSAAPKRVMGRQCGPRGSDADCSLRSALRAESRSAIASLIPVSARCTLHHDHIAMIVGDYAQFLFLQH
jgi:hypothetical protein